MPVIQVHWIINWEAWPLTQAFLELHAAAGARPLEQAFGDGGGI